MTITSLADGLRHLACVTMPGDQAYEAGRVPWNVAVDQRPAAVALPRSAQEVAVVVRAAAAAGLRVAPQNSGHAAAPLAAQGLSDVVLLRTSRLEGVYIDPARAVARVEGGALWQPVIEAAATHSLTGLHGSSPDIGVAGYSLGGGMGWFARKLGLACNSIRAVELVSAAGELVRADPEHETDLFWALRGGGGNFGVVTALELTLFPIHSAYAGWLAWDVRDAEKVLRRWAEWATTAPDHVTTAFRVLRLPPIPEIPEFLRGRELAVVDGAVLGSDEEGVSLLSGLRELGPELDTFGRVPAHTLTRLHQDPEGAAPFVADHSLLSVLDDAAVSAYLEQVGPGVASPLLAAELRHLGGALSRSTEGAGALDRVEGAVSVFAGGMVMTPEMGAAVGAAGGALVSALEPWSTGGLYLNFVDTSGDVSAAFPDETWRRLTEVRAAADPDGVFVANHPIPAAS